MSDIPMTIFDNSLQLASRQLGERVRILRWRPTLCAVHAAEEDNFYLSLNLKNRDFRSQQEVNDYISELRSREGGVPRIPPETPSERAMALIYETIGARKKKRVENSRQAIEIYPGCADAWVILSEYEKDPQAKLSMLREAVRAGEVLLDDMDFGRDEKGRPLPPGHEGRGQVPLWATEARPYLRAKLALALHLHKTGQKDEAIGIYADLMQVNPSDNQGVRHLLVSALLERGDDESLLQAEVLLHNVPDESPMWAWALAFVAYRRSPASPKEVPVEFRRAYYANPSVCNALQGDMFLPTTLPETSEYGSEEEAIIYRSMSVRYWKATPAPLKWLSEMIDRITCGLPNPLVLRTQSMRAGMAYRMRAAERMDYRRHLREECLSRSAKSHPEFKRLWMKEGSVSRSFTVEGIDPYAHVACQAAIDELCRRAGDAVVSTPVPDATHAAGPTGAADVARVAGATLSAMSAAIAAGLSQEEAAHLLSAIYEFNWRLAESRAAVFDTQAFISHLRWVARLASGEVSPNAVIASPKRNDPCPCGSDRKFKRCCASNSAWPIPQVVSFAHALRAGRGEVKSRRHLEMLSSLLGAGKYAGIRELLELPTDHPLVILDNTSAVAQALWANRLLNAAHDALQDNIELARSLGDRRHLATALHDALYTVLHEDGYGEYVLRYASELGEIEEDPFAASLAWSHAASELIQQGKMSDAEKAINRALSTGKKHPTATLVMGHYLEVTGHPKEALAVYREAEAQYASHAHLEEMAEEVRGEIQRLKTLHSP